MAQWLLATLISQLHKHTQQVFLHAVALLSHFFICLNAMSSRILLQQLNLKADCFHMLPLCSTLAPSLFLCFFVPCHNIYFFLAKLLSHLCPSAKCEHQGGKNGPYWTCSPLCCHCLARWEWREEKMKTLNLSNITKSFQSPFPQVIVPAWF